MRPLRLEAEGFTCYRDRQEPLDFSGLSLFAISGPTGAGKSSILDTMLYALYGEVPRIGKQGIGEFISHGRDSLSVCLDFALRGSTYRVTRRVKRGKKGNLSTLATLAEVANGTERSLADNVKPVNDAIARLLGLDYAAFIQTVVLPQGEFAAFLRAGPKEQRAILQHLLRHEIFEKMRGEAERRRGGIDAELRAVERELQSYDGATREALETKAGELAGACLSSERSLQERTALDAEVQESRRRRLLTEELSRLKREQAALAAKDAEVAGVRQELALARRAAEIVPRLESYDAAVGRANLARERRVRAERSCADVSSRRNAAQERAAAAVQAAEECGRLNERIRLIDEIKGDLDRRVDLSLRLDRLEKGLTDARKRESDARLKLETARGAVTVAQRGLEERQAAVKSAAYEGPQHALLEELWPRAVQVRTMTEEVERLELEHRALESTLAEAVRDETAAKSARERAESADTAAASALAAAAAAREDGRSRHQAAALRAHLHDGDECPVCLQNINRVPAVDAPPELEALERRHKGAEEHQHATRRTAQAAARTFAAAESCLAAALKARESSAVKMRERAETRDALIAAVVDSLVPANPNLDSKEAISWIETRRSELRRAKQAHDDAESLVRLAQEACRAAEIVVLKAEGTARAATDEHARQGGERSRCKSELEAVIARIREVSTHEDPGAERAGLAKRVSKLQNDEAEVKSVLSKLQEDAAAAAAGLAAAATASSGAEADVTGARGVLESALQAAGFATTAEASAAVRSTTQQSDLERTIQAHDNARAAVSRRLLEVEPQISGKEIEAVALVILETRLAECVKAWNEAGQRVSRLEIEHSKLAQDVEKRGQLLGEQEALRGRLSVTAEMASDLKGDAFQEYLLEEAFRALVTGASIRMREISNRYTLEWDRGDFYVVDHDNAGERRRAETLSGGETFMASLCLALQLSDEVLRTSGALQVDSLFIDEGFGTLDSDSLSDVTDAMEALRQEGGRLIGVISHRTELTDRLPGCIRIEKGAGESRWVLERVG